MSVLPFRDGKNTDSAILMLAFEPTTFVCKQTTDIIEENHRVSRSEDRITLSSGGTVEWNVFPKNVPPVFFCYGFSSNEDF